MDNDPMPKLSASFSLSSTTHSFANSHAPILSLTITSHHETPITIYADNLKAQDLLTSSALVITDLTTDDVVQQNQSSHCRIPHHSKIFIPLQEGLFHTLLPETPLTFSTPFTRKRPSIDNKPLPKGDPKFVSDNVRSTPSVCGVDGLEPGHIYAISLGKKPRVRWYDLRWWDYGTKDQILHPADVDGNGDGKGRCALYGRKVMYDPGPHPPITIDFADDWVVQLECRE